MQFDIITLGSASIDEFFTSTSSDLRIGKKDVRFNIGAKILMDELHTETGGGGLNTAIAFRNAGFRTGYLGTIGKDLRGDVLLQTMKKQNVRFLGKRVNAPTNYSVIFAGLHKNRTIFTYKGASAQLTHIPQVKSKWMHICTLTGKSFHAVAQFAKRAKKQGTHICFNPSLYLAEQGLKHLRPLLNVTDVLIFNKEEAQALVGKKAPVKTLLTLLQKHVPLVVITDGAKGASAYNGITQYHITPKKTKIVEVTGAGDAFASGFIIGLMKNKDIETCLQFGAANAQNVLKRYGATKDLLSYAQLCRKKVGRVECS